MWHWSDRDTFVIDENDRHVIVKISMILESMRKIWNDRELEYSCTTVKQDPNIPDRQLPDKSVNAKIRNFIDNFQPEILSFIAVVSTSPAIRV